MVKRTVRQVKQCCNSAPQAALFGANKGSKRPGFYVMGKWSKRPNLPPFY